MSDPRINDPDSAGPGGEFLDAEGQDPETADSGDSQPSHRAASAGTDGTEEHAGES
jgi:hypothetical protein